MYKKLPDSDRTKWAVAERAADVELLWYCCSTAEVLHGLWEKFRLI